MPKKLGHLCKCIKRFSIIASFFLLFVVVISALAFVWRVWVKPLDISFAKQYIEAALHDPATGNYVRMENVVLYWPDLTGPLYLQIYDGQLLDKDGAVIVSVDMAAMSFSRSALLMGSIRPKAIILEKPALRLVRTETGALKFELGQEEPDERIFDEQFGLTTRIFEYLARPGRQSRKKSLISYLEAFRIDNARLFIDDKIANQSWSLPDFDVGFYSTNSGMKGYIDLQLPDIGLDRPELHVNISYLWDQKNVEILADLKNMDIRAIAGKVPELGILADQNIIMDAHIETILDENFIPDDINIDITSKAGDIIYPDFSDKALPYRDLSLRASYHYAGKAFVLRDTQVTLKGVTVFASAEMTHDDKIAKGSAKLWIDSLKQEQIASLWPKILRGDNSEKWLVKKMSKGSFKDVWLGFDLLAEKKLFQDNNAKKIGPFKPSWDMSVDNLKAGFAFDNMSVDYRPPLDKVTNASGSGSFDLGKDELKIDINKAKLGALNISKAKLLFDKVVEKGKGDADISIKLNGAIRDVMRYLSKDPINLGDDINMDIEQVKGAAELDISLNFPARKDVRMKEFKIAVEGALKDVFFPDVIETLDLSGELLNFSVKDGLASMSGKAMLEKRSMDFSWEEFLDSKDKPYKEKVSAKITADPNLRERLGIDLSDFIEGSLLVDVDYILYDDGSAKADVDIDLTPALFFVEPFDFGKPAGEEAAAKLTAYLQNGNIRKIADLTAQGKDFKLFNSEVTFTDVEGKPMLASGSVSHFTLEETRSKLDFVFDDMRNVKIVMDASFIDARPFMDSKDKEKNREEYLQPPMRLFVTAKNMRTSPSEVINDVKLFFDIDGKGRFNRMEMDAKVGAGDLRVRFKPDNKGKRTFRLVADDAGAFLKAFQIYEDIRGGTLAIYGEPMRWIFDRNLRGKAEISNFRVVNEPALAKILSILSLTGIGEVLSGEGLNFEKLESDFSWLYRSRGSLLVLKNGRTSGNSLGLLFEGTFDNQKHEVDVSGTIVPMSALNEAIGSIPIIGDILTGGSGGVFAATYSIKGSTDNPVISVNPLSILTPGILRRILWE